MFRLVRMLIYKKNSYTIFSLNAWPKYHIKYLK